MAQRKRPPSMTYKQAGVDLAAAEKSLDLIRKHVASTRTAAVLADIGPFGGLFRAPTDVPDPVLVASADGVGTKLIVARKANRHDTVGEDLVNHCVNDILVMGARPLFFLDYLAVGRLDPFVVEQVVAGVARGCRRNGVALLGGEMAEMPDMYRAGEYDLAGTIVGVASQSAILSPARVRAGDAVFGLASTGLHTNGYSLARKIIFEALQLGIEERIPSVGASVADALLAVHRSYWAALSRPLAEGWVSGLAHITGGGLTGNVPRALPDVMDAELALGSWPIPPLFQVLRRAGQVPDDDALCTFNLGIGMVAIVPEGAVQLFIEHLTERGERHWRIGRVVPGSRRVSYTGVLP